MKLSRRALLALAAAHTIRTRARAETAQTSPVRVRATGDGSRVWVLLHPFGASGRFWDARARALAAEHGVQIVAPDLPSHGASALVERFDYDIARAALVQALRPFLDRVDLIIGASSGGITGLKVAATLTCPVAAIGVGAAFTASNLAAMRAQRDALRKAPDAFVGAFLEQGEPQRAAIARHYGDLAGLGERPLLTSAETLALAGRVLVINGQDDTFFAPESALALTRAIQGSSLMLMSGAGHLEPLGAGRQALTWGSIAAFATAYRR